MHRNGKSSQEVGIDVLRSVATSFTFLPVHREPGEHVTDSWPDGDTWAGVHTGKQACGREGWEVAGGKQGAGLLAWSSVHASDSVAAV